MAKWISSVALIAALGTGAATWPAPGEAQDTGFVDQAERLSDAITEQHSLPDLFEAQQALRVGVAGGENLLGPEALDDLVAPVALYPDALLAQVLVAATYPLQIVKADRLIAASPDMTDAALSDAVASEDWDPSVLVLLAGFPSVIELMADDLDQTEQLGIAMLEQDADVLLAVQRMRERAAQTGYLTSNAAHIISKDGAGISIRPADPEVVYVPSYDPVAAFTSAPTAAPYIAAQQGIRSGQTFPGQNALITGAVAFGAALLVNELFGEDDDKKNRSEDDGWDDYWGSARPIDWRTREFYPRPYRQESEDGAWSRERDRHWDRSEGQWRRRDAEALRQYEIERRDALDWLVLRAPDTGAARVARTRDWRDDLRARRDVDAQELRRAERRAAARTEARRDEARAARQEAARAAARGEAQADARALRARAAAGADDEADTAARAQKLRAARAEDAADDVANARRTKDAAAATAKEDATAAARKARARAAARETQSEKSAAVRQEAARAAARAKARADADGEKATAAADRADKERKRAQATSRAKKEAADQRGEKPRAPSRDGTAAEAEARREIPQAAVRTEEKAEKKAEARVRRAEKPEKSARKNTAQPAVKGGKPATRTRTREQAKSAADRDNAKAAKKRENAPGKQTCRDNPKQDKCK